VLSTTYGVGNGTTTFNVPDLRGYVVAGKDDMGGSAASRLTGTTMSPNGTTVGATGGAQTNTASTTSTGQTNSGPNSSVSVAAGVNFGVVSDGIPDQYGVSVFGTSGAFSTVQPTIILNYIIRI
jgi:microcystin-dependent protein